MKKRTKNNLAQMAALLPELDAEHQRGILGGTAVPVTSPDYPEMIPVSTVVASTVVPCATPESTFLPTTSSVVTSIPVSTTTAPPVETSTPETATTVLGQGSGGIFAAYWENLMDQLGLANNYLGVTIYSERFQYSDSSTISRFYASSSDNCVELVTGYFMEPAWNFSESMLEGSNRAIYPGEYEVIPYSSAKYKDNYKLEDVPGRSSILIHTGNKPSHTKGCLLPGENYSDNWVGNSVDAYNELNSYLKKRGGDGIRIIINTD